MSELVRGGKACAKWLGAASLVNFRATRPLQSKDGARRLIAAHFHRFLTDCGIDVDVSGGAPEPGNGCVVCYNESSFADVAAFCQVMWPHIDRAAAADLYAIFPWGRSTCHKAGIELVPRGNRLATEALMARMVEAVKSGERLAWGGEGRISGLDGVARFKVGAALIAIRAQVPIYPVAFCGGQRLMPFKSIRARPGTIHVQFGASIPTTGLQEHDARDLADHAQMAVAALYDGLRQRSPMSDEVVGADRRSARGGQS